MGVSKCIVVNCRHIITFAIIISKLRDDKRTRYVVVTILGARRGASILACHRHGVRTGGDVGQPVVHEVVGTGAATGEQQEHCEE